MWSTDDIHVMLSNVRDLRQKALIHFLAASGVRRTALRKQYDKVESFLVLPFDE